jgi:hypothetical protein
VHEGERVTVDGATGLLYRGEPEVCFERPEELIGRVLAWQASLAN